MRKLYLPDFSRNTRLEKHVPRFPGTPPNSPGLGVALTPALTTVDASSQVGPVFAVGAQAGGIGGAGCFGLQGVDVVLTSAQILLLLGTPITLVPAPSVGFKIVPVFIKMIFTGGTVAFTDAGGAVSFLVGAGFTQALASNAIFLVTVSPNRRIQEVLFHGSAAGVGVTGAAANPPTEDAAALTIAKVTNNFAGGGNGTMKITVWYVIEPTT